MIRHALGCYQAWLLLGVSSERNSHLSHFATLRSQKASGITGQYPLPLSLLLRLIRYQRPGSAFESILPRTLQRNNKCEKLKLESFRIQIVFDHIQQKICKGTYLLFEFSNWDIELTQGWKLGHHRNWWFGLCALSLISFSSFRLIVVLTFFLLVCFLRFTWLHQFNGFFLFLPGGVLRDLFVFRLFLYFVKSLLLCVISCLLFDWYVLVLNESLAEDIFYLRLNQLNSWYARCSLLLLLSKV